MEQSWKLRGRNLLPVLLTEESLDGEEEESQEEWHNKEIDSERVLELVDIPKCRPFDIIIRGSEKDHNTTTHLYVSLPESINLAHGHAESEK